MLLDIRKSKGRIPRKSNHRSRRCMEMIFNYGDFYRQYTENGDSIIQPKCFVIGKVIVPKTQISPEMGYFGMFIDTEGNKMAVHSINQNHENRSKNINRSYYFSWTIKQTNDLKKAEWLIVEFGKTKPQKEVFTKHGIEQGILNLREKAFS